MWLKVEQKSERSGERVCPSGVKIVSKLVVWLLLRLHICMHVYSKVKCTTSDTKVRILSIAIKEVFSVIKSVPQVKGNEPEVIACTVELPTVWIFSGFYTRSCDVDTHSLVSIAFQVKTSHWTSIWNPRSATRCVLHLLLQY